MKPKKMITNRAARVLKTQIMKKLTIHLIQQINKNQNQNKAVKLRKLF